jgi:hypothetical protein
MRVPTLHDFGILLADHLVKVLSALLLKDEILLLNDLLPPGLYAPLNLHKIEGGEA